MKDFIVSALTIPLKYSDIPTLTKSSLIDSLLPFENAYKSNLGSVNFSRPSFTSSKTGMKICKNREASFFDHLLILFYEIDR